MLNKFAQGKINLEQILDWFGDFETQIQRNIIRLTGQYLIQSHPNEETFNKAIQLIPLKPTATAIVLLKTHKNLKVALDKIELLPDYEIKKTFISLISVFKTSDIERRNTYCQNNCYHDWHNLDNFLNFS
jgi:mannosyltransferase OCH1-like enzyme